MCCNDWNLLLACRSLKESSNFAKNFKQKLPANISEEDLLNFSVRQEYDILRVQCPLLFHVVTGAMGLTVGELEVFTKCWLAFYLSFRSPVTAWQGEHGPK